MKSCRLLLVLVIAVILESVRSHVIIKRRYTDQIIEQFYDLPAQFGPSLPSNGIGLVGLAADPEDGCSEQKPPSERTTDVPITNRKFVLIIARNNCTFEEKVRNAMNAKYDAAIVYNVGSDDLEQMSAKNSNGISIPSVFIGETPGRYILTYYEDNDEYVIIINDELPFNINTHLILPFSILVGLCFIIMICYMIYKCVREQRRLRQHRLPKRLLKKLQVIKFADGHPYETCAICLEDYAKGERLRVLPCAHVYHCHCIDVWLTKNRRVCPICKRKVFARGETRMQARRRHPSSDSTTDTDDDTQPLLDPTTNQRNTNANNHGTFRQQQQQQTENQPQNDNEHEGNAETDDENILTSRVNPFNRNQNLPPNLENELTNNGDNEPRRGFISNLFKLRLFRRHNSLTTPLTNEIVNPILDDGSSISNSINSSVTVNVPRSASNNVLNSNLSGSFKDSDDEMFDANSTSIYESIINNGASSSTNNNPAAIVQIDNTTEKIPPSSSTSGRNSNRNSNRLDFERSFLNTDRYPRDDIFIQTPSQGGIGVAALPNTNFNNQQQQQQQQPGQSSSRGRTRRNFII